MTQSAGLGPRSDKAALLIAIPLATAVFALVAGIIAWLLIGVPFSQFDPLKLPEFFWYYRGDPVVMRGMAAGAGGGAILTGGLFWLLLRRPAPLHGDARFANEREIKAEGLRDEQGIVVGRKGGRFLTFGGSEHVLLEAPTRSGKGVGVVIPNLLSWPDSAVILDVKRENWDATAGFRNQHGQDVYLFNPTSKDGRTARYNPLGYFDRNDPIETITELQKIATMLFPPPDKGDPFWTESAKSGFIGVGALIAATPGAKLTIGEIYRRMTSPNVRADLRSEIKSRQHELSQHCVSAVSDFASGADNTFSSIKQTITGKLNLWLNPHVDAATSESDFDLRDLRKRRISIYLGVSPDELDRVAPLYNLFFQQLVDLNTRDLAGKADPVPILAVLDEFARLGRAEVLANSFSYVAGYGIRLLAVIQSRSQLRGVYGDHMADEIVANCGLEIAFTPKELRVANELSERIGYTGQKATTKSLTIHGAFANRSRSESEQKRALLLPQELMQFPRDELLLLRGGIPPVRGNKIRYYESKFFMKRLVPAPSLPPSRDSLSSPSQPDTVEREATEEELNLTKALPPGSIVITKDATVIGRYDSVFDNPPPSGDAAALTDEKAEQNMARERALALEYLDRPGERQGTLEINEEGYEHG